MSENKVIYGLQNAHYAKLTFEDGVATYATPVALEGAVELSMEPESETIEFSADDDSQYFNAEENNGYTGTLSLANMPYDFRKDILGEIEDTEDGVITEISDAKMSPFALLFQFDGDATKTRHLVYYCNGQRAKVGSKTGKEVEAVELAFKAKQLNVGGKRLIKTQTTSEESAKYEDWFKKVYIKQPAGA